MKSEKLSELEKAAYKKLCSNTNLYRIDADTMKLVFFDSNSEFHGKDVSKEIYYIKREFIAYEQYLYLKAHKT